VKSRVTCDGALIGGDRTTVDVGFAADHYHTLMIERRQLTTWLTNPSTTRKQSINWQQNTGLKCR